MVQQRRTGNDGGTSLRVCVNLDLTEDLWSRDVDQLTHEECSTTIWEEQRYTPFENQEGDARSVIVKNAVN